MSDDWDMGDAPPPEPEVPQDEDLLIVGALPDASPAPVVLPVTAVPPVPASPRASVEALSFRGVSPLPVERKASRDPTRPIPYPAIPWRGLSTIQPDAHTVPPGGPYRDIEARRDPGSRPQNVSHTGDPSRATGWSQQPSGRSSRGDILRRRRVPGPSREDFAAFSIHCWRLYGRFSSHGLAPGGISLRSSSQLTEKDMSSTTAVHTGTHCFLFPNVRSRLSIIYVSRPIKIDEVARLLEKLQAGRAVFPDQASYEDERD